MAIYIFIIVIERRCSVKDVLPKRRRLKATRSSTVVSSSAEGRATFNVNTGSISIITVSDPTANGRKNQNEVAVPTFSNIAFVHIL